MADRFKLPRALSEEPDATVCEHVGDVYLALGQKDKAREAWQKSLSIESSDDVKKKLDALPGGPPCSFQSGPPPAGCMFMGKRGVSPPSIGL